MPQSTPLKYKRAFVFGPPLALATVGILLLLQSWFAGPSPDPTEEQKESSAQQQQPLPNASLIFHL